MTYEYDDSEPVECTNCGYVGHENDFEPTDDVGIAIGALVCPECGGIHWDDE